jgi:4-amino-4-deoxy-L-arabinose transferase-like glycosyltransferase
LAGIAGTMQAGAALAGPKAGLAAGLLLALTPAWWGHQFNNPVDLPFAAAHAWALAMLLRWINVWPEIPSSLVIKTGIAIGLALGTRIGGVILLGYLALASLLPGKSDRAAKVMPLALAAAGVAWAVMMVCWPMAQRQPVHWPWEALTRFAQYYPLPFSVLFGGQMHFANRLPWDYLPRYLLLTLPEPVLIALTLGAGWLVRQLIKWHVPIDRSGVVRWGLVVVAAALPLVLIIAMRSVVYNGIRHVLFIVPAICVLAGAILARLLDRVLERGMTTRVVAGAAVAGWLVWHGAGMIRIHPHQYIWYNAIGGGLRGAFLKYEIDYWGNAYPEAIAKLTEAVKATGPANARKLRVAPCGAPRALREQLPDVFEYVEEQADADVLIGITGFGCGEMRPGAELAWITRDGVPLAYVRALRR